MFPQHMHVPAGAVWQSVMGAAMKHTPPPQSAFV